MTTANAPSDLYPTRHHEEEPIPRTHPTVWGTVGDGPFDGAATTIG